MSMETEVLIVIIGFVASIIGFFCVRVLNQLEGSVKGLTQGLSETTVEMVRFIAKTETILKTHADLLDAHGERLNSLK